MEMPACAAGSRSEYPATTFHYVFVKILMAGRANGLQVIDGPREGAGQRRIPRVRTVARRSSATTEVGAAPGPGADPQRALLTDPGAVDKAWDILETYE
jgi:hypothetical protein